MGTPSLMMLSPAPCGPPLQPQLPQLPQLHAPGPPHSPQASGPVYGLLAAGTSTWPAQYSWLLVGEVVPKPGPQQATSQGSIASTNSGVTIINSSISFCLLYSFRNGTPIIGRSEI